MPFIQVQSRHMCTIDLPDVLEIENLCFDERWTEADFKRHHESRQTIAKVAINCERVCGFYVYQLRERRIELITIAVHPAFQRHKIGTQIISDIKSRVNDNRLRLTCLVHEEALTFQLFLRECGFTAEKIVDAAFEDGRDGWRFNWREFERVPPLERQAMATDEE